MQLPENAIIFCLIDSLPAYEKSERRQDTIYLMKRLVRLVKTSKKVAMKLLVTSPGQSIHADRWVEFKSRKAQMLHVPLDL